jgi:hypothetical protein
MLVQRSPETGVLVETVTEGQSRGADPATTGRNTSIG